jgi:hypothetical protein
MRRNANVLYRRWLCVEFDISPVGRDGVTPTFWAPIIDDWSTAKVSVKDAQVRLLERISKSA